MKLHLKIVIKVYANQDDSISGYKTLINYELLMNCRNFILCVFSFSKSCSGGGE